MRMKLTAAGLMLVAMSIGACGAWGQSSYPNKPIRIIASEIGGGADITARIQAIGFSEALGQPVIVDNRASTIIAIEVARLSSPDGYSLLVSGPNLWLVPLFQKTTWDPFRDFSPISLAYISRNILVVQPSLPVKSVKELIALAKAKPGELNYGTSGVGAGNYISGELFKYMANIDSVRINYKSGGALITGLLRGEIHYSFGNANTVRPLISSGKLRALAVTSANETEAFPDLPTVAATLPGFESIVMNGMLAPAKTPPAIIERLSRENSLLMKRSDVKSKFEANGLEVVSSTPAEFAAMMKAETTRVGTVVKAAGLKAED